MKILYKFTAHKKEKVEEKTVNEDESVTIKLVDKEVPVDVYLKHPSRRDREEISVIYNGAYGNALKQGLQTADVMRRCLLDSGGIIAQKDLERADELLKEITLKANEIQEITLAQGDLTGKEEELQELTNEFELIERPQREIFSKSAEAHAQNKTIEWCVLNLSFTKDKDYEYVFRGPTFESKLESYYKACDDEDKHGFELAVYDKATVVFYHHILGNKTEQEYFDLILA